MASFLKNLSSRLLVAGFKFYQHRTLNELRYAIYRQYDGLIRSAVGASRGVFAALVAASLVVGGLVLLPLSGVALLFALIPDPRLAAIVAFLALLAIAMGYILIPVLAVFLLTRESFLRKVFGDARAQEMLLKK